MSDREELDFEVQSDESAAVMTDEEARLEQENELRERWPTLYAEFKERERQAKENQASQAKESAPADEVEAQQRLELEGTVGKRGTTKPVSRKRENFPDTSFDEILARKASELEERERKLLERERKLEKNLSRIEHLHQMLTEKREIRGSQNETLLTEAEKIQQNVDEFSREIKLRVEALTSMVKKPQKRRPATPNRESESMDVESTIEEPRPGRKERKDFNVQLKMGQNKWKEGDDYGIWRRLMRLEFARCDCLFLVDSSVKPLLTYSSADVEMVKNAAMGYILSNFPEAYQRVLENCVSPLEMIQELDRTIHPPSNSLMNAMQVEFMNLFHDPSKESVIEFRARVQRMINEIRRNPGEELTNRQIRRNVLGAIAGAYPKIHEDAVDDPKITTEQIFERMAKSTDLRKDHARRASQSAMLAGTGASGSFSRSNRKRKAPPRQGDSAAAQKEKERCFRCGLHGHWAVDCDSPDIACYNCRGFGHKAAECERKSRLNSGKSGSRNSAKRQKLSESDKERNKSFYKKRQSKREFNKTPAQDRLTSQQKSAKKSYSKKRRSKSGAAQANRSGNQDGKVVAAIATRGDRRFSSVSSPAALAIEGKAGLLSFIADSGATEHMVNDISVFSRLWTVRNPINILCANKKESASLEITQVGDIIVYNQETNKLALLTDVLYAPGLLQNLFAVRKQIDRGLVAQFNSDTLEIVDKNTREVVKRGNFIGRFWWISFELPMLNKTREENLEMVSKMRGQLNLVVPQQEREGERERTVRQKEIERESIAQQQESERERIDKKRKPNDNHEKREKKRPRLSPVEKSGGSKMDETDAVEHDSGLQSQGRFRTVDSLKWHHRLNHASLKYLVVASKVMPELKGVHFTKESGREILDCSYCKLAKAKRKPCSQQRRRSEQPFHRLYSDLVGPMKPGAFRTQAKYFCTFTDDASRYAFAYEMEDKTKVCRALSQCLQDIRKISGPSTKVAELRIDGGLEYQTAELKELLKREEIAVTVCEPYTPQHNGTAERLNLELEEKIRVNLIASGVPTYLWPFTMRHVLHVHNRTPNASNDFKSPFEVVMREIPSIKHLRRYGCEAYVLDPKAKQKSKFAPRANLHFLVECGDTGYTLFHPVNRTVIRSKDVDFVEERTYSDYQPNKRVDEIREDVTDFEQVVSVDRTETDEREDSRPNDMLDGKYLEREREKTFGSASEKEAEPSTSSTKIGETREFEFFEEDVEEANLMSIGHSLLEYEQQDPVTYKEAVNSSDAKRWKKAVNQEFAALERCKTWKIIDRREVPKGAKVMTTRWVHKRKTEANGDIRFRSRLVARGFADTNSYELSEIYAPVARLPDVRFVLIAAAKYGLNLAQLDVKTAFLNGTLDKFVYVEFPEGYAEYLGHRERERTANQVCEVHKALYGLKVSPRRWFERFLEVVEKLNFSTYKFQPCLFIWREGKSMAIMLLYVDDILLASNCARKTSEVKATLQREFSITDLGTPKKFLGMEIEWKKNGEMRVHQTKHIEAMLAKFYPGNCKKFNTPMLPDFGDGSKRELNENSNFKREDVPYRQAIGTLLYIQNGTRPDISYAVNVLSRRQSDFTERHWDGVKRVMGYLAGTKDLCLSYTPTTETIDCFVDASLGMSAEHGHSTTGFAIYMFGCLVAWRTQKQNHVALSSAEAEFVAMSKACRELASLRTMCSEILQLSIVPMIHEDSKPAIRLAEVDESSTLKHLVRLSYLYVREEHKRENIQISWIGTEDQVADAFTKPLSKSKFLRFRDRLMSK